MGQSNRDLQSPVPACHFWADHKYKMLYVRAAPGYLWCGEAPLLVVGDGVVLGV